MSTHCASLGHVSNSACNRRAVVDLCTFTNANRISSRKSCPGSGPFFFSKQVVLTLPGRVDCSRKIFPRRSRSCESVVYCFLKRKSSLFLCKSAEGTENSVTEDHSSGLDEVEKPSKRWFGKENIGAPEKIMLETQEKIDINIVSDSSLPGKSFDEKEEVGEKITHAGIVSLEANVSGDPGSEEKDRNRDSVVDHYPHGEDVSLSMERSQEIESRGDALSGDGVTDDYSSEPLLDNSEEVEYVTRIMVPRQRYIRIPKAELVDALSVFSDQHQTKLSSMCDILELVLHAKHKYLLEELRADYKTTHSTSEDSSSDLLKINSTTSTSTVGKITSSRRAPGERSLLSTGEDAQRPLCDAPSDAEVPSGPRKADYALAQDELPNWKVWVMNFLRVINNLRGTNLVGDNGGDSQIQNTDDEETRTTSAKRFQRNFLKLLKNAQFEGLSAQDLELAAVLNSNYLLTLPISVNWKRAAKSNTSIYKRGYAKEQQKGLLIGAKFDYLQSALLKQTLRGLTRPLISTGRWIVQKWRSLRNDPEGKALAETVQRWAEEPLHPEDENSSPDNREDPTEEEGTPSMESEMDLPIWKAAQQAVPRYEAVLSSAGSRGLLLRGLLVLMGLLPSDFIPVTPSFDDDSSVLEPHLRPNFISRVSMKDIWLPASKAVIGENSWKRFRAALSVFSEQVTLQEPAFQELVLLYTDDGQEESEASDLQLKMYKTISVPDLKIVFPNKKLSFRVIDTLRLDLTTLVGLAAFLYNYHFEGFLSSPSAFALDVIAASTLLVFLGRAALGYKQTWDRYQLLVNKTLYEKTLANGFGVVHFLIDASEEQQFKEAIIAFSILSQHGKDEGMSKEQLAGACERLLYYRCKEQTEMPVDSAIKNLLDLGLIYTSTNSLTSESCNSEVRYKALTYDKGFEALMQYWESLPSRMSSVMVR